MCASPEFEIEVANGIAVDKFPLRRGTASRTRFHGIAWPVARNRFPARRVEEHYVESSPARSGCRHPVASRRSNIISGKQFSEHGSVSAFVDISKLLVVAPIRFRDSSLSSLFSPFFVVAITRVASTGNKNPPLALNPCLRISRNENGGEISAMVGVGKIRYNRRRHARRMLRRNCLSYIHGDVIVCRRIILRS